MMASIPHLRESLVVGIADLPSHPTKLRLDDAILLKDRIRLSSSCGCTEGSDSENESYFVLLQWTRTCKGEVSGSLPS
jgi:hypothetical protein